MKECKSRLDNAKLQRGSGIERKDKLHLLGVHSVYAFQLISFHNDTLSSAIEHDVNTQHRHLSVIALSLALERRTARLCRSVAITQEHLSHDC